MVEFIQNNWFWIVLVFLFLGMHSFGGGCCGMGQHAKRTKGTEKEAEKQEKSCH